MPPRTTEMIRRSQRQRIRRARPSPPTLRSPTKCTLLGRRLDPLVLPEAVGDDTPFMYNVFSLGLPSGLVV